jgi:ParB-like chromosome segregation protein Spo0J
VQSQPRSDTKAGIIAGHGRLLAARKLQLIEVPVIVLDHLNETQKRAYIFADIFCWAPSRVIAAS